MDRFIASGFLQPTYYQSDLKSNMDRLIGRFRNVNLLSHIDLKSNMDRFIASKWIQLLMFSISFKIQYG